MLYITWLWLIYFITGSLYLIIPIHLFLPSSASSSPPATTSLFSISIKSASVLLRLIIILFFFKRLRISGNIDHLFFSVWFIWLRIILSESTHVVANGKTLFFLCVIFQCMNIPYLLYLFIYQWIQVVSISWLFYIMLLWTLESIYIFELVLSFLWINTPKWNCWII